MAITVTKEARKEGKNIQAGLFKTNVKDLSLKISLSMKINVNFNAYATKLF